jgi:ribonucleoside-diphosphate reductase alpha chain
VGLNVKKNFKNKILGGFMQINEWLDTELGKDIWSKKYQYNNESFEEWLDRVSGGNDNIRKLIKEKKFLFGGRILANRGLEKEGRKITLSNCYVVEPPKDNIESIFECAKKLAKTFSYGGGVGIDISGLSPKGSKINNAAKETTGSVSFMDLYSLVTELIGQSGRRGALMISLDCSHPDLLDFINVKSDLNKVTKANISIRISDEFINAVRKNLDWTLTYTREETGEKIEKIVKAKEILNILAKMNWDYSEPGMLYWDKVTNWNLLSEDDEFEFAGVNPCAEEPLPAGGSCLLGSINLSEFVIDPFSKDSKFDMDRFRKAVESGIVALNEVLHEGLELHPLQEQRDSVNDWRQVGLGLFGWHDALIKLGYKYGGKESIQLASSVGYVMINIAIQTSANLTDVYGRYPKYKQEAILKSEFFKKNASLETRELVMSKGLANSQLLTIPPTGSIGTMLGVSTALEPIYAVSYTRKTESLHGKDEFYKVYTPIIEQYMKENKLRLEEELPDFINTAMTLDYEDRINMQGIWQQYIDASISSTVNVPNNFTVEEVEKLYLLAHEKGLKGVTIYRDGCKREGILSNDKPNTNQVTNYSNIQDLMWGTTIQVSDDLIGRKRKIMSGCGSLHVQAWFDPIDGRLMEIYLSKGSDGGCNSFMIALSREISAGLRTGLDFKYAIDQLKSVPACPSYSVRTATKKDTSKGNSCPSAIAYVLLDMQKEVLDDLGIDDECNEFAVEQSITNNDNNIISKSLCPECKAQLSFSGGCNQCLNCGYSRCE